jgi:hypothetical protein
MGTVAADSGTDLTAADGDPTRVLIRRVLGAVSQFEKSVIVAKLRAARLRQHRQTGRCEGRKPFGAHPGEQAVLRRIRHCVASRAGGSGSATGRSRRSSTPSGCRRGRERRGGRERRAESCGVREAGRDHRARAPIEPECTKWRRWWWQSPCDAGVHTAPYSSGMMDPDAPVLDLLGA